jgi:hypothetical protein
LKIYLEQNGKVSCKYTWNRWGMFSSNIPGTVGECFSANIPGTVGECFSANIPGTVGECFSANIP